MAAPAGRRPSSRCPDPGATVDRSRPAGPGRASRTARARRPATAPSPGRVGHPFRRLRRPPAGRRPERQRPGTGRVSGRSRGAPGRPGGGPAGGRGRSRLAGGCERGQGAAGSPGPWGPDRPVAGPALGRRDRRRGGWHHRQPLDVLGRARRRRHGRPGRAVRKAGPGPRASRRRLLSGRPAAVVHGPPPRAQSDAVPIRNSAAKPHRTLLRVTADPVRHLGRERPAAMR